MDLVDGGNMGKQECGPSLEESILVAESQSCALADQNAVPQHPSCMVIIRGFFTNTVHFRYDQALNMVPGLSGKSNQKK